MQHDETITAVLFRQWIQGDLLKFLPTGNVSFHKKSAKLHTALSMRLSTREAGTLMLPHCAALCLEARHAKRNAAGIDAAAAAFTAESTLCDVSFQAAHSFWMLHTHNGILFYLADALFRQIAQVADFF